MCSPKKSTSSTSKNRLPEQPPEPRRNDIDTLPSGEGIDESHTAKANSIHGKTFAPAGVNILGQTLADGRVDNILGQTRAAAGMSTVGELRPRGTAKGSTDWYKMCTEILGSESLDDVADHSSLSISRSSVSSSSRMCRLTMRANENLKDLPPILSTLDSNGRPRFSYKKERSNGRLTVTMVANNNPEIVGTVDVGDSGIPELNMLTSHDEEDNDQESRLEGGEEE